MGSGFIKKNVDKDADFVHLLHLHSLLYLVTVFSSVADPDPNPDPFGPHESGSGSISQRYGSGSISQRHGSAPDPHQNVMDPQH